ncbi:hypothetical protein Droror1_Dr00018397 [Drosera rotundifolia]
MPKGKGIQPQAISLSIYLSNITKKPSFAVQTTSKHFPPMHAKLQLNSLEISRARCWTSSSSFLRRGIQRFGCAPAENYGRSTPEESIGGVEGGERREETGGGDFGV